METTPSGLNGLLPAPPLVGFIERGPSSHGRAESALDAGCDTGRLFFPFFCQGMERIGISKPILHPWACRVQAKEETQGISKAGWGP
jgi:hypothetical protein